TDKILDTGEYVALCVARHRRAITERDGHARSRKLVGCCITPWIPAQPIPLAMGPLAFAMPIDVWKLVEGVAFNTANTSYDRGVAEIFAKHRVAVDETPFEMGEVSFHHNLSFHTAAANRTTRSRVVLANTFFADGARLVDNPTMVSGDWQKFMPGAEPGGLAASELNPVCWPPEAPLRG
ncbi:MAG: hypothetical protein AAF899_08705, partial [Pseudomonadota bacterium]